MYQLLFWPNQWLNLIKRSTIVIYAEDVVMTWNLPGDSTFVNYAGKIVYNIATCLRT